MRVLLLDTSAHGAPWPLFLQGLNDLAAESQGRFDRHFVDEAAFLSSKSLVNRAITRGVDWLTVNVRRQRVRLFAYEGVARVLGYHRHPLHQVEFNNAICMAARRFAPEVVLVVMGFDIWPQTLEQVKKETGAILINYASDDPFNRRTGTKELREAIPLYDLYACTKKAVMHDVAAAGCANVRYVQFGYQPTMHFVESCIGAGERERFTADVAFVGEADADRLPFLRTLLKAMPDLKLALYGGLWEIRREFRPYSRGTVRGRDFRMALGAAKIAINLVRVQNRDDHVMRTFEGPACGAFMLSERTDEHLALFAEDREAAYFESADELVEKVRYFLKNDAERERIREAGHRKVTTEKNTYRDRLMQMLSMSHNA